MMDDANCSSETAILVLGQCLNKNATPSSILVSRLEACAKLQQELQTSNRCIMFSGGDTAQVGVTEAKVMQDIYQAILRQKCNNVDSVGPPPPEIILEENSLTTVWNALFCLPLLQYKKIQKVHLITSDFHMPRSMLIFESVFHHSNIQFVRHAVPIPLPYQRDDGTNGLQPLDRHLQEKDFLRSSQHPLAHHVMDQTNGFRVGPVSEQRVKQCQEQLEVVIQISATGTERQARKSLWKEMTSSRELTKSKIDTNGRYLPFPNITIVSFLKLTKNFQDLPAKLREIGGEYMTPLSSDSYHATIIVGPVRCELHNDQDKAWETCLYSPRWQAIANFLQKQDYQPALAYHRIHVDNTGGISVRLSWREDVDAKEMDSRAKSIRNDIRRLASQKIPLTRPILMSENRPWHITLSYGYATIPEDLKLRLHDAVKSCFSEALDLGPAHLCLSPDMTRFVPWTGESWE